MTPKFRLRNSNIRFGLIALVIVLGLIAIPFAKYALSERIYEDLKTGNTDNLTRMVNLGLPIDMPDSEGHTPLMYASAIGDAKSIMLLINAGAKVDATTEYGLRPLIFAANAGRADAIRLLIKCGADVDAATDDGQTALHWAIPWNHKEAVKALLECKADCLKQDDQGVDAVTLSEDFAQVRELVRQHVERVTK